MPPYSLGFIMKSLRISCQLFLYHTKATTTEISKTVKPATFSENQKVAQKGGSIAGNTRKEIEDTTGKPVITSQNAKDFRQLITDIVEDAAAMPEQTEEIDDNKDE